MSHARVSRTQTPEEMGTQKIPTKTRLIAFLLAGVVRILCGTVRLTVEREPEMNAVIAESNGGMFVTWHGRVMLCIHHYRGRGYFALVSLSRDGDLLAEYFRYVGMRVIRGSSKRGGAGAARQAINTLNAGGTMAFTPDGPRGPLGSAQPGVAYFALKSGRPIIPVGVACTPCRYLSTWDKHLIPLPFSRAHWVHGNPIFVREGDDLEIARQTIEAAINEAQARAEAALRK